MPFRSIFSIAFISLALTFTGCLQNPSYLLTSGGEVDEVLIIVDDDRYQSAFSDTLVWYFTEAFPALPDPEPVFSIRIRSYSQIYGSELLRKYRNIIYCSTLDRNSKVTKLIHDDIGDEGFARAKTDSNFYFSASEDWYATPQQVISLFGTDTEDLIRHLHDQSDRLFHAIQTFERRKIREDLYLTGQNHKGQALLRDRFGLSLKLPGKYYNRIDKDNLQIFTRVESYIDDKGVTFKEVRQNIMVAKVPWSDTLGIATNPYADTLGISTYPYVMRDTVAGRLYAVERENQKMSTVYDRKLRQRRVTLNGIEAIEIRALWSRRHPPMGGPYLSYIFDAPEEGYAYVVDAWAYAPGSDKRPIMRKLEVILTSLKWADDGKEEEL